LLKNTYLYTGAPNMIGGRTPVTTPPNVVMGYPMGSSERLDRSLKESHHSPATPTMPQQVRNTLVSKTKYLYFIKYILGNGVVYKIGDSCGAFSNCKFYIKIIIFFH
jgi:hypothetical protein